jgi:integrase
MDERRTLSSEAVKALQEGKTLWCALVIGFGARGGKTGQSFFLNYRHNGRDKRITIGRFGTWTVVAARARAQELRREVDQGHDPAGAKRERREAPTVQDLIDRYIAEHLPSKAPGTERDDRAMLAEIARHLGRRTSVADIHDGDVGDMHRKISESPSRKGGKRTTYANRVVALCSKMFALSLRSVAGENKPWRDQAAGNPCKGVARNSEFGRERFYSEAELAAIGDALAAYPLQAPANVVRLVMLTGCRPKEALTATWDQFSDGVWTKPAATTKQRKVHRLPLSPPAIELIERLRKTATDDLVFPDVGPLASVWAFVRKRAGFGPGERLYDLRHSFASIGAAGGLSLPIIGKLLGHSHSATTQRYAHLDDDPLKRAAAQIGAVISNAGKPVAKVAKIG